MALFSVRCSLDLNLHRNIIRRCQDILKSNKNCTINKSCQLKIIDNINTLLGDDLKASIRPNAAFGRILPKNKIYEHAHPSTALKELFVRQVDQIVWKYKLAHETINLRQMIFTTDALSCPTG